MIVGSSDGSARLQQDNTDSCEIRMHTLQMQHNCSTKSTCIINSILLASRRLVFRYINSLAPTTTTRLLLLLYFTCCMYTTEGRYLVPAHNGLLYQTTLLNTAEGKERNLHLIFVIVQFVDSSSPSWKHVEAPRSREVHLEDGKARAIPLLAKAVKSLQRTPRNMTRHTDNPDPVYRGVVAEVAETCESQHSRQ